MTNIRTMCPKYPPELLWPSCRGQRDAPQNGQTMIPEVVFMDPVGYTPFETCTTVQTHAKENSKAVSVQTATSILIFQWRHRPPPLLQSSALRSEFKAGRSTKDEVACRESLTKYIRNHSEAPQHSSGMETRNSQVGPIGHTPFCPGRAPFLSPHPTHTQTLRLVAVKQFCNQFLLIFAIGIDI